MSPPSVGRARALMVVEDLEAAHSFLSQVFLPVGSSLVVSYGESKSQGSFFIHQDDRRGPVVFQVVARSRLASTLGVSKSSSLPPMLFGGHIMVPTHDIQAFSQLATAAGGRVVSDASNKDTAIILGPEGMILIAHRHQTPLQLPINGGDSGNHQPLPLAATATPPLPPDAEGGVAIPTLRIDLLKCSPPRTVYPNNIKPIRMENECFEGYISFYIRTEPLLPQQIPVFEGRQRKFSVQLQGRFKVPLSNPLFGAEITNKMELGLLAKGFARTILTFLKALYPDVHSSFGDDENSELPHICIPLYKAAETLVVTPPGDELPRLGDSFPTTENDKLRKAGKLPPVVFDTISTYTFGFHNLFMDFPHWQMVNFPMISTLDLHLMWSKSALRFVVYEPDFNEPTGKHFQAANRYVLIVQLQHRSNVEGAGEGWGELMLDTSSTPTSTEEEGESDVDSQRSLVASPRLLGSTGPGRGGTPEEEEEWLVGARPAEGEDDNCVEDGDEEEGQEEAEASEEEEASSKSVLASTFEPTLKPTYLVPAWVEVIDRLSPTKSKRQLVYIFVLKDRCLLRPPKLVTQLLNFLPVPMEKLNTRYSEKNLKRLRLAELFAEAMKRLDNSRVKEALMALMHRHTTQDKTFLSEPLVVDASPPSGQYVKPSQRSLLQGPVARCFGDYHWVEEYAILSKIALTFFDRVRDTTRREARCKLTISVRDILGAKVLPREDSPYLPGFFFFEVETLGRVFTLMVPKEEDASTWVGEILNVIAASADPSGVGLMSALAVEGGGSVATTMIAESYLSSPTHWSVGERLLLNARRSYLGRASRKNIQSQDPCRLVAQLLEYGLTIDPSSSVDELVMFLDSASAIKHVRVDKLTQKEMKAFLINVYHLIILHSHLILGLPPSNPFKWCTYFNMASYECCGEIFSIAELEHNIIRANMTRPRNMMSRFIIPTARFPFTLDPDYRISFALNVGSLSLPPSIAILSPESVDVQLENLARLFFDYTVRVEGKGRVVVLPKVCQWYDRDFPAGVPVLAVVAKHTPGAKGEAIKAMLKEGSGGSPSVKYRAFSFESRHLMRLDDDAITDAITEQSL